MSTLAATLTIAGPLAVAAGWLVVRSGRASLWLVNGTLLPLLGAGSLITGEIRLAQDLGVVPAILWGLLAGAALYAATAVFMSIAGRWPPLARHTAALYETRSGISLSSALLVSVVLAAPAEELLWRGVVLAVLQGWIGPAVAAAIVAWIVYAAANAVSGTLPIVLGSVVGGAVWTALAQVTGGVGASVACHVLWTGLMLTFPPVPRTDR